MRSEFSYLRLAAIPLAAVLLLAFVWPLFVADSNFRFGVEASFYIVIFVYVMVTIVGPVYLIALSRHFLVKRGARFALCVTAMAVSDIGSVLALNRDRWSGRWDYANEMAFVFQTLVVGVILLAGVVILAVAAKKAPPENRG